MPRELSDFTPFGYLRNPSHSARAWGDTYGGNLRTMTDRPGVEWVYPVGRDASSRAGLALGTPRASGVLCNCHTSEMIGYAWQVNGVAVQAHFFLADDETLCARVTATNTTSVTRRVDITIEKIQEGSPPQAHHLTGDTFVHTDVAVGEQRQLVAFLVRGNAEQPLADSTTTYARILREDAAFIEACPTLGGDWPAHWREGLHHDFQTTRLLVQPAGGIFTDVWPSWMTAWPRVVLAEGTLDMLRLAYADPSLALRAVATLFRDAPEPNVPCVFQAGEYNMVAADGSRCGTSPAWCLPFLNLQLLYLRTLDRGWLAQLFPAASAYVDWWLANRTDPEGWVVYKCTWESGEDGNPRLDPAGSGDADISCHARPVELQATVAHAAGVLAFFAAELGLDGTRWRRLETDYRERTRQLFDPTQGRYRDWLISEQRLQANCPERPYWGIDPCRYSAQSLTPLLLGLPLDESEVWRHAAPPWTLWPSWTWSVVESAAAAGLYAGVGELAFQTIDRVYRVSTRRDVASLARPMPGASPEFWPEDWRTYAASDAYGWGATTANLLIRHLFGLKESTDTSDWRLELTPAFPRHMLVDGAIYAIRQLQYRGRRFDLTYTVLGNQLRGTLEMEGKRHEFDARLGERFTLGVA